MFWPNVSYVCMDGLFLTFLSIVSKTIKTILDCSVVFLRHILYSITLKYKHIMNKCSKIMEIEFEKSFLNP